jgi:hypothetical protein
MCLTPRDALGIDSRTNVVHTSSTVVLQSGGSPSNITDPEESDTGGKMRTFGQTLTTGGTVLVALLIFTVFTGAQTSSPSLIIHNFAGAPSDGAFPYAGLTIGPGGIVYGTTYSGGTGSCFDGAPTSGCGTVFSLTPPSSPGGSWTESVLHNFTSIDGNGPTGTLVMDKSGVLYGTTSYGGTGFCAGGANPS